MIFYILRRTLYAIPIALGVSVVCFSLVYIAPGDPLQTVMPPDATAETIEIVKHAYGFDKPLPVQYLIWLGHVVTGDLSVSISTRRQVILEVTDALANTSLSAPLHPYTAGLLSSTIHGHDKDRDIDAIPGSPPDMRRLPPGCSFAPRCVRRSAACCSTVPEPRFATPERRAACLNLPEAAE